MRFKESLALKGAQSAQKSTENYTQATEQNPSQSSINDAVYPNFSDDPAPISQDASEEEVLTHLKTLKSYTIEMVDAYK